MAATVTIAIDGGALLVEDGVLHLGELAPIAFTGYEPADGNTIRLTLFDRDGKTPLADNPHVMEIPLTVYLSRPLGVFSPAWVAGPEEGAGSNAEPEDEE